jgi:uncharacterized protein YecE (DUF72 family)
MDFAQPPPAIDGIRVGVGGWTFAPWRKNFYPDGLVQKRELEYASRHLSTIEVNGTFYRAQKPATYAQWRDETPDGFVFSAKAPMRIVQAKQLATTGGQVEAFVGGIAELGDKLGPIVWQLERRLDRDDLAAFVALLPREADGRRVRHVLDVRDAASVDADLIALARQHGVAAVYTDSDEHPSFADATADFVYARLMRSHGDVATGYPDDALDAWARRAREWAAGGEPADLPRIAPPGAPAERRDVFIYFIGAAKERNPAAAMALLRRLGAT